MDIPGVLTVDDMLMRALGMGGSPLGALLGPMLKPMLYGALGLESGSQRDALLDFVVSSNMTPFGTAMELRNRQYTRIATANMQRMQQASMQSWLTDFSKTTMSFNSWRAAQIANGVDPAKINEAAYEAAMTKQAKGWASNPLWGMVYKGFDPDGMVAASEYLQTAGANIIRRSTLAGRRGAFLQARALTGLFTDENGNDVFDKANYGYMGRGEVAALTAAITRDIDVFGGDYSQDKLKDATKRLSTMLQNYAKALSPLKDVFGKDVPAMIKAVEELSGRTMTSMSASSIGRTVRQVLDGATAGNYTLQQVADMSNAWRGALLQTNVSFLNDLASTGVATNILNATAPAGAAPRYMSQARWEQMAGDHVRRASISRGGEMFAQAYAVMLQNNQNLTFEQFMSRYNNGYNGSIEGTLYAMTGARNAADLQRMAGASGMLPLAYERNVNTQAALEMGARVSRTRLRDRLRAQGYGTGAIDEALNFFDRASRMDFDAVAGSNLSAGGRAVANTLLSLDAYQSDMTNLRTLYNNREAEKRAARISRTRQLSEQIMFMAPGDMKEAITGFIQGRSLSDMLLSNDSLQAISNPEAMRSLRSASIAAGLAADDLGLTGDAKKDFTSDMVKYHFTNGMMNEAYLNALDEYKNAKGKGAKRTAARKLALYQYADADQLKAYSERHKGQLGALNSLVGRYTRAGKKGLIKGELSDYLIGDAMMEALDGMSLSDEMKAKVVHNLSREIKAEGQMSSADWTRALTKDINDNALPSSDQAVELKEAIGMQQQSLEALLTDKFNILEGLGKAINDLVVQLKKNETRDNTASKKD